MGSSRGTARRAAAEAPGASHDRLNGTMRGRHGVARTLSGPVCTALGAVEFPLFMMCPSSRRWSQRLRVDSHHRRPAGLLQCKVWCILDHMRCHRVRRNAVSTKRASGECSGEVSSRTSQNRALLTQAAARRSSALIAMRLADGGSRGKRSTNGSVRAVGLNAMRVGVTASADKQVRRRSHGILRPRCHLSWKRSIKKLNGSSGSRKPAERGSRPNPAARCASSTLLGVQYGKP